MSASKHVCAGSAFIWRVASAPCRAGDWLRRRTTIKWAGKAIAFCCAF